MAFTPIKDPYRQIDWGNPITRGLTAAFRFNEGGGTKVYDIARNRYHGSFLNSPTWGAGIRGKAVNLSGTAQIQLANIPTPATPNGASIVILYKCTSASNLGVVTIGDGSGSGYWGMGINALAPYMYVSGSTAPTGTAVSSGQWVHVVGTYRDTQRLLYQNGLLAASTISGWSPSTPSSRADIGSFGTGQQLQGAIDHVYIFARELSKADVQALFADPDCIIYRPRRAVLIIPPMSGTGSSTFADMTCAGVGVVANPITGTGAFTFGDMTCAGAGTVANPITGTAAYTFDPMTAAGTASYVAPVTGTASISFDALTVAGSGTYSIDGHTVTSITFDALAIAGSGTVVNPVTGTAAITFADLTATGSGNAGTGGQASITFDNMTVAGAGLYTPAVAGQASITFDSMTSIGDGHLVSDITGAGHLTTNFRINGAGTITAPITGQADFQFGSMSMTLGRGQSVNPGDTQDYPTATPAPLMGHRRRFLDRSSVTTMDSGRVRKRRMFDNPSLLFEVQWSFTADQFDIFKDWFENTLFNGENPFLIQTFEIMDPPYYLREVDWIFAFMAPYKYSGSDNLFQVTATLLVVEKSTLAQTIDNPTNPPPPELSTPTLEHNFEGFACQEMFNLKSTTLTPLKAHTLEISESKNGPWRPHVYFVADAEGKMSKTFNNDYRGLNWFQIRRDNDKVVVARPTNPPKSFVEPPQVSITNTQSALHDTWFDMAYNSGSPTNNRLNRNSYYIVPRQRLLFKGPASTSPSDGNARVVQISNNTPGVFSTWTRDNSDPGPGTTHPKYDGQDDSIAVERSDFGMAVRARSFVPDGGCKSPISLVLVDKAIWQRPFTTAVGEFADESDTCDISYTANLRTDWTRGPGGTFLNGLTPIKQVSGDSCDDFNQGLRKSVIDNTRSGLPAVDHQKVFQRSTLELQLFNKVYLGTGDNGDFYMGWDQTHVESSTFHAGGITIQRQDLFWDGFPKVFTNSTLAFVDDSVFPGVLGTYIVNKGVKDDEVITGSGGTAQFIELSWGNDTVSAPEGGDPVNHVKDAVAPLVGDDGDGLLYYTVYVILTLHNDFEAPKPLKDAPPLPPIPPTPPYVPPTNNETWEEYPTFDATLIHYMDRGTGYSGHWDVRTISSNQGYEPFDEYPFFSIGQTSREVDEPPKDSGMNHPEGWAAASWLVKTTKSDLGFDTFEPYILRVFRGNAIADFDVEGILGTAQGFENKDFGTNWNNFWFVRQSIRLIYGLAHFEEYQVGPVPVLGMSFGTNFQAVAWVVTDTYGQLGRDDWEYSALFAPQDNADQLGMGTRWAVGSYWRFRSEKVYGQDDFAGYSTGTFTSGVLGINWVAGTPGAWKVKDI